MQQTLEGHDTGKLLAGWCMHAWEPCGVDAPSPAKLIRMMRVGSHISAKPARTTPPPPALFGGLPLAFAMALLPASPTLDCVD